VYQEARRRQMLVPSGHYQAAGDLRPFGLPIRLSMYSTPGKNTEENPNRRKCELDQEPTDEDRFGMPVIPPRREVLGFNVKRGKKDPTHKIEIYDTADKSGGEMLGILNQVFDIPTTEMEVTRLDTCVDVIGTSVDWFRRHAVVKGKQTNRVFSKLKPGADEILVTQIWKALAETWCAGVKPNQLRFYDKTAERKRQLSYENRKRAEKGENPLEFEERFGYNPELVVTRIERQYGGGRVTTVPMLPRLVSAQPFHKMQISPNGAADLTLQAAGSLAEYLQFFAARRIVEEKGRQFFEDMVKAKCPTNKNRVLDRLMAAIATEDDEPPVTVDQLNRTFQKSVAHQLGVEYAA
jgi:hypothetical protein